MELEVLKEKLHEYIDGADEQHLSAIYVLVSGDNTPVANKYDEATMNMLHKMHEDHLTGRSKSYTMDETFAMARQAKK